MKNLFLVLFILLLAGCSDSPVGSNSEAPQSEVTLNGKQYEATEDLDAGQYVALVSIFRVSGGDTTFWAENYNLTVPESIFYPGGVEFFLHTNPLPLQDYRIKIVSSWGMLRAGKKMRISIYDWTTQKDDFLYELNLNGSGQHLYQTTHSRYDNDVIRFYGTNLQTKE